MILHALVWCCVMQDVVIDVLIDEFIQKETNEVSRLTLRAADLSLRLLILGSPR